MRHIDDFIDFVLVLFSFSCTVSLWRKNAVAVCVHMGVGGRDTSPSTFFFGCVSL